MLQKLRSQLLQPSPGTVKFLGGHADLVAFLLSFAEFLSGRQFLASLAKFLDGVRAAPGYVDRFEHREYLRVVRRNELNELVSEVGILRLFLLAVSGICHDSRVRVKV